MDQLKQRSHTGLHAMPWGCGVWVGLVSQSPRLCQRSLVDLHSSYLWPLKVGPPCEVPNPLSQLSSRTEECLLLLFVYYFFFTSYLSGNDRDQRQQKEDSLFQRRTPTPFELFTQPWPDFTREWEREGTGRLGAGLRTRSSSAWEQKLLSGKLGGVRQMGEGRREGTRGQF